VIRRPSLAGRGLAAAAMIAGSLLAGARSPLVLALVAASMLVAALPLLPPRQGHRTWAAAVALGGFAALAAVGLSLGLGAGWMLLAVVAALAAWDLQHLEERLWHPGYAASRAGRRALEAVHLRRLLAVAVVGLLLGSVALVAQTRITFLPALLLSLLALLGLGWVVAFFRAWGQ
jgi:hypothetical protein